MPRCRRILSIRPITGLGLGENVLGIDTRPSDGKLYALTALVDFGTPRLFTIDPSTGAGTLVAALTADPADLTTRLRLDRQSFRDRFQPSG